MKNKNLVRFLSFVFAFSLLIFAFGISSSADVSEPVHSSLGPQYFYDIVRYDSYYEITNIDFISNGVQYYAMCYTYDEDQSDGLTQISNLYYLNSDGNLLVYTYVENEQGEYESTWLDPSYKCFILLDDCDNAFLEACSYSSSSSFLYGGDYSLNIDHIIQNIPSNELIPLPFVCYGVEMSGIHIIGSRTPYDVFEVYFLGADGVSSYLYGSYDVTRVIPWECDERMNCLLVDDYYAEYETITYINNYLSHYEPSPPSSEPSSVTIKGKFTFTGVTLFPAELVSNPTHAFNFINEDGEVFSGMHFAFSSNYTCSLRYLKLSGSDWVDVCSWDSNSFNGFDSVGSRTIYFTESTISSDLYSWLSSVGVFDETADVPPINPDPGGDPGDDPGADTPDNPLEPLSILPGGSYVFNEHLSPVPGSIPGSYFEIEFTFFSKSSQWHELSIYNSANNKCVDQVYYTTTSGDSDILLAYKNNYNGYVDVWESYSSRIIRIPDDAYVPTAFYNWFISNTELFDDGGDDTTSFDNGVLVGYERGYEKAKDYYYKLGFEEGSLANGGNFLSNFFGSILDALDNLTIVGDLSFLDVVKMIVGLFVCLWVLKLLGGG